MKTDIENSRVRRLFNQGFNITQCARKCNMDRKTAAGILRDAGSPNNNEPRVYRTRKDPLEPFWIEIEELLKNDPKLKAYIVLEEMLRRHPKDFLASWKRTLERRVRDWKFDNRVEQEVFFDQKHLADDVMAIDFTHMNELNVTIAGRVYDHMVFHSLLTYSNWEYAELCLSESFEAVASGVSHSFEAIGGVTRRLRNDSMSAAVNNLSSDRHFRANFTRLIEHFDVKPHRINVRSPEENGDCEPSHRHFKDYVDQRLRVRSDRNFSDLAQYKAFLKEYVDRRNETRRPIFLEEQSELEPVPAKPFPCFTQFDCMVTSNTIITVKQNRYSVPSCYIGHRVQIRVLADSIELWHAAKKQFAKPRLIGKGSEFIDSRHVIDSLVRKPGAFANYRYREHMYPTLELRKAFDHYVERLGESEGTRVYLRLLLLAKQEGLAAPEPVMSQLKAMGDSLALRHKS